MNCRTASKTCSANNSSRRARWPSRLACSAPRRKTRSKPQPESGAGNPPAERPEDPVQAERERRAYVSLFSSNVALTYRKTPSTAPPAEPEATPAVQSLVPVGPDSPQVAQLLKGDATEFAFTSIQSFICLSETIPRNQPMTQRRKTKILPPCRLAPPMRRQENPICCLKERSLKPFSSTAWTAVSQVRSSACSQPTCTRMTASTC